MILRQVIIKKNNSNYRQLCEISNLLDTQDIKNNGKIIVTCKFECDLKEIRQKIRDIFNCSFYQIRCHYEEKT